MFEAVKVLGKPCVIFFLGGDPAQIAESGAYCAATLEEAAKIACQLARGEEVTQGDYIANVRASLQPLADAEKAKLKPGQKYLRGLFCGGTHSEESVLLLQDFLPNLHSNLRFGKVTMLENRHVSVENSLVDMGDEEFTKGKPHPVMDPSILNERMIQEGTDPETAVLLFDMLLGYGVHDDPVGTIEETLREIRAKTEAEGRYLPIVASICGTDLDPQNFEDQKKRLEALDIIVLESNGQAAMLAGLIAKEA